MDKIKELLNRLAPIIKESEEKQEKRMETGFNLFYLISDHYYRETFHSDIIAALLSPKEKHGGGRNMKKWLYPTKPPFLIITLIILAMSIVCFAQGITEGGVCCLIFGLLGLLTRFREKRGRRTPDS